jgi:hypothetical protein
MKKKKLKIYNINKNMLKKKKKKRINKGNIIIKNNEKGDISDKEKKDMKNKEYNELPYHKAKIEDKRNIFKTFLSFFMDKIELIKIIFQPDEYTNIYFLFNLYIISSFIDLFMNCLLYNDYAISQKYHNNGTLEYITSIVISLLSNIISSFILFFIEKLGNYSMYVETILKNNNNNNLYLNSISKFFKIVRFKFILLILSEILLSIFMTYYLFLFGVINSYSINSFILNYGLGLIESILYSICLCLIISFIRKISLIYDWKRLYIISKYIDEHF